MSDDVWKNFADMLADLFAKYGSKLLEIEREEDNNKNNNIDLADTEERSRKEKGLS